MATNRFPFTVRRLDRLQPTAKLAYFYDADSPLALWLTPGGVKTFCIYRKVHGRPQRVRIGRFPDLALGDARKAAERLVGTIAEGRDPGGERRRRREEPTLGALWDHWLAHAKGRKRTWGEDERQWNKHLKAWAGRRLSTITKTDVAKLHAKVGEENGPYTANRLLALLRAMFNKADDLGFDAKNPCVGVPRFPEEKRDRFLGPDELGPFFKALAAETDSTVRDYLLVALLTGARKSNVLAMRWDELDLRLGLWRIPSAKHKSGRVTVIPLVGPALRLLQERRLTTNGSPWVFPHRKHDRPIPEPRREWVALLKRAGLENVHMHDLRRSLGSWMAITGTGLPVIGGALGHTTPASTAVYARLTTDPIREAAERAVAAMLAAGGVRLLGIENGGEHGDST